MEGKIMSQKGLSLIELLVALTVLGILIHLSAPSFRELIEAQRRHIYAEQLVSGLRNARTEAILRNQDVVIHALNGDWSQGWRVILDQSGQGQDDKDNPVLIERQDSGQVPIVGNRPVKNAVRFSSLGEPLLSSGAFQAGTLHVCETEGAISHYQVVLSKTGRVSLRNDQAEQALCGAGVSEQRADT